jgi:NhaA family Na+:H+ antiporter
MTRRRDPFGHFTRLVARLSGGESGAGLLLIAVAAAALMLANSDYAEAYHAAFHHTLDGARSRSSTPGTCGSTMA